MFGNVVRIIGIDPGLTRCGVAVIEGRPGARPRLLDVGVIRTPSTLDHAKRLLRIHDGIEEWVTTWHPDHLAVERAFTQHNVSTVAGTMQAAGIAMLIAARHGIPAAQHTPSEAKAAITGYGGADKAHVGAMVARICGLTEPPKPADAADAVALAVCHLWRGGAANRYAEAVSKAKGIR